MIIEWPSSARCVRLRCGPRDVPEYSRGHRPPSRFTPMPATRSPPPASSLRSCMSSIASRVRIPSRPPAAHPTFSIILYIISIIYNYKSTREVRVSSRSPAARRASDLAQAPCAAPVRTQEAMEALAVCLHRPASSRLPAQRLYGHKIASADTVDCIGSTFVSEARGGVHN